MGRVLALDYGSVRIGVAISDSLLLTAQPLEVIPVDAFDERFVELTETYDIDLVVIGMPTSLDGSQGPSAAGARRLAKQVEDLSGIGVEFVDERFTTSAAERTLIEGKVRRRRRRQVIDKIAAALILEHYLEGRRR